MLGFNPSHVSTIAASTHSQLKKAFTMALSLRQPSTRWPALHENPTRICYKLEWLERKRKAQRADQQGKQTIQQAFAAAAAKKHKKQEDEDE